jgi:hypothetical protein
LVVAIESAAAGSQKLCQMIARPFVELDAREQQLCAEQAAARFEFGRRNRWQSRFTNSVEREMIGCNGECGAAKFLEVDWRPRLGSDHDSGDLKLPSARLVDVKARPVNRYSPLIDKVDARFIYVFTEVQLPRVFMLGWIEGALIAQVSEWLDSMHMEKPCWSVPWSALRSVDQLRRSAKLCREMRAGARALKMTSSVQ